MKSADYGSGDLAYLNTASFGVLSAEVSGAIERVRRRLAINPAKFMLREAPNLLWASREAMAGFLRTRSEKLMFTVNVSASVSLIAASLLRQPAGVILLSEEEYPTMRGCWDYFARRHGWTIQTFPIAASVSEPEEILQAVRDAITAQTRILFFSHVTSRRGVVLPVEAICKLAQQAGITTVVDGAQAVLAEALDLGAMSCDFYVGSCHKWLLAPSGSSFIHLGCADERRLSPGVVSWGLFDGPAAEDPDARNAFGSTQRLRPFECEGTRDICPWLVLPDVIGSFDALGVDEVRKLIRQRNREIRALLQDVSGVKCVSPPEGATSGGISTFALDVALDPDKLQAALESEWGIEVACARYLDETLVRVSPHIFNTEGHLERLATAIRDVLWHG